jgi:thioredoxin-like negative regulator of GroEL
VEAHFNLGNTFGAEGKTKDQAAEYQRAADLAPDNIGIRIELCEALVAAGDRSQALKICTEVDNLAHKSNQPGAVDAAAQLRRYCEGSGGS